MEPEDSLIMGDYRYLPEKESDEVIKSSVEDLVPIPRKYVLSSNSLFDSNDDFTSSGDESLSDEDVPKDNVKIFMWGPEYKDIESKDSYVSNLDEPALLATPLSDANEDECFDQERKMRSMFFLDMRLFLRILRTVITIQREI
ncbi:hypothetical protein Tco_0622914 [Tanacetum coccineum]